MIQRIQSVYLALSVVINALILITPLYTKISADPSAWLSSAFLAALFLNCTFALVSIFLFKNREKQTKWITYAVWFQALVMGSGAGIILSLGGFGSYLWDEVASWLLLALSLAFQLLAKRGVQKDIHLVKSMDRIR